MGESILQALTEFGAAGLIGVLWILERGHASKRDRQLDEAHRLLNTQGRELEIWLRLGPGKHKGSQRPGADPA